MRQVLVIGILAFICGCKAQTQTATPGDTSRTVPSLAQNTTDAVLLADANLAKIAEAVANATAATLDAVKAAVKILTDAAHAALKTAATSAIATKTQGIADADARAKEQAKAAAELRAAKDNSWQAHALFWIGAACCVGAVVFAFLHKPIDVVIFASAGVAFMLLPTLLATLEALIRWTGVVAGAGLVLWLAARWYHNYQAKVSARTDLVETQNDLRSLAKSTVKTADNGLLTLHGGARDIMAAIQTPGAKAAVNAAQGRIA